MTAKETLELYDWSKLCEMDEKLSQYTDLIIDAMEEYAGRSIASHEAEKCKWRMVYGNIYGFPECQSERKTSVQIKLSYNYCPFCGLKIERM